MELKGKGAERRKWCIRACELVYTAKKKPRRQNGGEWKLSFERSTLVLMVSILGYLSGIWHGIICVWRRRKTMGFHFSVRMHQYDAKDVKGSVAFCERHVWFLGDAFRRLKDKCLFQVVKVCTHISESFYLSKGGFLEWQRVCFTIGSECKETPGHWVQVKHGLMFRFRNGIGLWLSDLWQKGSKHQLFTTKVKCDAKKSKKKKKRKNQRKKKRRKNQRFGPKRPRCFAASIAIHQRGRE